MQLGQSMMMMCMCKKCVKHEQSSSHKSTFTIQPKPSLEDSPDHTLDQLRGPFAAALSFLATPEQRLRDAAGAAEHHRKLGLADVEPRGDSLRLNTSGK